MKRLIAAVSFAVLAAPALAEVGKPYEQLDVDRALPNIEFAPVEAYVATSRAPYEQLNVDRALPNINFASRNMQFAEAEDAGTRIDAYGHAESTESAFANDWNFIAPAQ